MGEIVGRLEAKQLRVVAAEMRVIDRDTAARHYAEHEGRDYYDALVEFITSGPALVMIVEGPEDTWQGRARDDGSDQSARRGTRDDPRRPRT